MSPEDATSTGSDPAASPAEAPPREERALPPLAASGVDPWGLAGRIVAVAVATVVALWLLVTLRGVVLEVVLAVILASGLHPLVERLYRTGMPRVVSVLLIYLGFILLLVLFGVLVVPPVLEEINQALVQAPGYGERATQWLVELQERFPFLPRLDQQLVEQVRGLGSQVGALASQALVVARFALSIFTGILSTFVLLLITLYLIVDGPRIREYFLSFAAPKRRAHLRRVTDRMGERMGGWLLGQLALSGAVGVVTFVGLTVLGVPGAVLLALVAAVGEVIPIVGPVLSAVPAVAVALSQSPLLGLLTLALYIAVQQVENNLLVPKIMERAVQLHPLAVVLSLLVGGQLLGIPGAIVAVPVAAAISVVLDELRNAQARSEQTAAGAPPGATGQAPPG